jgi:hypothetical protein
MVTLNPEEPTCFVCDKPVSEGVSINGYGVAHEPCYESYKVDRFKEAFKNKIKFQGFQKS